MLYIVYPPFPRKALSRYVNNYSRFKMTFVISPEFGSPSAYTRKSLYSSVFILPNRLYSSHFVPGPAYRRAPKMGKK